MSNCNENIRKMLEFNAEFVESGAYKDYQADKFPKKKVAIFTCMDTRLVTLLPAALGLKNGDVKMIKNAGAVIDNPFDSVMRSVLIAVYELGVEHVMVVAHTTCGVQGMKAEEMMHLMKERGIKEETLTTLRNAGIDLDKWLTGFDETESAVMRTVSLIKNHPLLPSDIEVTGYIMETDTGRLNPIG
ncbi:MAG: carbonic anhydrase [Paramuribaculum sp.]|nr:carbonic anhydrase [Paramuribaculum sp.]